MLGEGTMNVTERLLKMRSATSFVACPPRGADSALGGRHAILL